MSEQNEVAAEIAGNKFSAKNLPLNWIAIIGILFISGASLWQLNDHRGESKAQSLADSVERKEDRREIIAVLKEMSVNEKERTTQQKITNCLIARDRPSLIECERIVR